jgi:hypothetical protein
VDSCAYLYEHFEERQKPPKSSRLQVSVHRAWIVPITEADPITTWPSSECYDEHQKNQAHDRGQFDCAKDEFEFSVEIYGNAVDSDHRQKEDCGTVSPKA